MTKGVAMANKKLVNLLLQDENANVANDEFETLSGSDWVRLLSKKPQFADKCEWHKLTGKQWSDLLLKQPQFVIKCDLNKIEPYFYQLSDKYKDIGCYIEINELPPKFIARLLAEAPQFAGKCNQWNNFSSFDWSVLLSKQPQFADICDKREEFGSREWSILLAGQPQFAEKYDRWNEFNISDWSDLLRKQPQFADKCDKWDEFDGADLGWLLIEQPQFAEKFNLSKLNAIDWSYLLRYQPQFVEKCDFCKFNDDDWFWFCWNWKKFSKKLKMHLMQSQPKILSYI